MHCQFISSQLIESSSSFLFQINCNQFLLSDFVSDVLTDLVLNFSTSDVVPNRTSSAIGLSAHAHTFLWPMHLSLYCMQCQSCIISQTFTLSDYKYRIIFCYSSLLQSANETIMLIKLITVSSLLKWQWQSSECKWAAVHIVRFDILTGALWSLLPSCYWRHIVW
jgi:hypothetical protein